MSREAGIALFALSFVFNAYSSTRTSEYVSIPLVKEVSKDELDSFNSYVNGCDLILESYGRIDTLVKYDPTWPILGKDCSGPEDSRCKSIGDYRGIQDLKDSLVSRSIALIDGPANLRREPNGLLLKAKLADQSFVLITRAIKDWRFVTDGESTGWTHIKNLRPKPDKIYIKASKGITKNGKDLERTIGEWRDWKKNREYEMALSMVKPPCPKGMTHFDEDGLSGGPNGWPAPIYEVYVKCGGTKHWNELPRAVSVSLKVEECSCYAGNVVDGYLGSPAKIKKTSADFKFQPADKEERCRIGKHFIICETPGSCYGPQEGDCSMPAIDQLICPKDCLTWIQK